MKLKPATRLAFLLTGAFALGIIAGNGANLRHGIAQGYLDMLGGGEEATKNGEGPGYPGLIPGYVDEDKPEPEQAENAQDTQDDNRYADTDDDYDPGFIAPQMARPQMERPRMAGTRAPMTPIPRKERFKTPKSMDEIQMAQMQQAVDFNWANLQLPREVEDALANVIKPEDVAVLDEPRMRIGGMLPQVYSTQNHIDRVMQVIEQPGLTKEERKINARKGSEKLRLYAMTLKTRQSFPVALYKKIGAPDSYIQEDKDGITEALNRVEAAIATIQKKYE